MRTLAALAAFLFAAMVLAGLFFVLYGRAETWALLTGPNDPGSYDFAKAPRRATGNDALACSPGLCSDPDFELPVYALAPEAVIDRLSNHLLEIDPKRVDERGDPAYARFLTFSPIMRFPDAIDIQAAPPGRWADGPAHLFARQAWQQGFRQEPGEYRAPDGRLRALTPERSASPRRRRIGLAG